MMLQSIMSDTDRIIRLMLRHTNLKDMENSLHQQQIEADEQEEINKEENDDRTKGSNSNSEQR